jgi:hypothetical protein
MLCIAVPTITLRGPDLFLLICVLLQAIPCKKGETFSGVPCAMISLALLR